MPRIVLSSSSVSSTASAVADLVNGWTSVYWTNPGGSVANFNRLYYRRSGSAPWWLLVDNIGAVIGSQQNLVVADMLALNTPYDFAISAVTNAGAESALAWTNATLGVSIATAGGGFTAVLHVQGQAQAYSAPLMLTGGPAIKETLDVQQALMWGLAQPVMRFGTGDFREITLKAKIVDLPSDPSGSAAYARLAGVLAQLRTGATGVLRTADGSLMTVSLRPTQDIAFLPQIYLAQREVSLNLVQIPNQYSPSTTRGSALGYLQQAGATVTPLNPVEAGI